MWKKIVVLSVLAFGCSSDDRIIMNRGEDPPALENSAPPQRCLITEDCRPVTKDCFPCLDGGVSCPLALCENGYCVTRWKPVCM